MVFCRMNQCPYHNENGFCGRGITTIDQNGMCSILWLNGRQRDLRGSIESGAYQKEEIVVIDAEVQPLRSQEEINDEMVENEEVNEVQSEDL